MAGGGGGRLDRRTLPRRSRRGLVHTEFSVLWWLPQNNEKAKCATHYDDLLSPPGYFISACHQYQNYGELCIFTLNL